jgi:hypothetical protein
MRTKRLECRSPLRAAIARARRLLSVAKKFGQSGKLVGVNEIDSGIVQFQPAVLVIGRRPKADAPALLMRLADDFLQLHLLADRQRPHTAPLKVFCPIVANERHEAWRRIGLEVGQPSIDGHVALALGRNLRDGPVAREHDRDGIGLNRAVAELRQHISKWFELFAQNDIGRVGFGFEVDQQSKRLTGTVRPTGEHAAAIQTRPPSQRLEVERAKPFAGTDFLEVMRHEQLAIDQEHVRFDAAESLLQRVEQWPRVQVVIVRVSARERLSRPRERCGQEDDRGEDFGF